MYLQHCNAALAFSSIVASRTHVVVASVLMMMRPCCDDDDACRLFIAKLYRFGYTLPCTHAPSMASLKWGGLQCFLQSPHENIDLEVF